MVDVNAAAASGEPVALALEGRITAQTAAPVWRAAIEVLDRNPSRPVVVDATRLESMDFVGVALIFDLLRRERPLQAKVEIRSLARNLAALVESFDPKDFVKVLRMRAPLGIVEHVGHGALEQAAYLRRIGAFVGACALALWHALRHRGAIRWGEVVSVAAESGANAVPIVLLVGFLMGVITAFEIGLVARNFGALIFVVNGVGIAMLREMGPLMTAIVFAGRTGAAFAAQIGTQKVNEEVNAISTFGLDPIHFLVVPRLIAAALVLPLLVVMADIIGLFGGALVMATFDVGFLQFYNQLLGAVDATDFLIGIAKAAAFGLTIAAIGCERGLATGAGATSVGLSATSAVVSSIVMIVVIDGIFTVLTS